MQSIKTLIFYIFMIIWTIVIFTSLSILFLTFNSKLISIIGNIWARVLLKMLYYICQLSYEVHDINLLPKAPCIIASKHQSMWETIFFTAYFKDAKYILKKELTRIPIYGWYLLLSKMIYIDRKLGIRSIKKIVRDTTISLKQGNIVIIFPEGTRVMPQEDKAIQPGVVAIHKYNKNIPIVPVSLNSGLYWPKQLAAIKSGKVKIKFHQPIIGDIKKEQLTSILKKKINCTELY